MPTNSRVIESVLMYMYMNTCYYTIKNGYKNARQIRKKHNF